MKPPDGGINHSPLKAIRHNLTRIHSSIISILLTISVISLNAQVPVANFTGSPLAGCSPLIVTFQDQSTGGPSQWLWDFGNGNTSTISNPVATYFTPGTYTVSLKVTNANGTNTMTRAAYITVYEPPNVNFTANNTSGCFPLRVQFTDQSTPGGGNNNVSWQWDFGNGVTSTQQNPLAIYPASGSFTVTLKVTNDKGCVKTFSRTNYINVTQGVKAQFTHSQPSVCRAPASITFTNTSTGPGPLSYQWNFGDGNFSTLTNPVHTFNSSGSYVVTLIATSPAGCVDTLRSNPIVIGGYATTFTASANACRNIPITFTNTSNPAPDSTRWNFGDGSWGTGDTITHTYSSPGSYTVWMYSTYPACRDSVSQVITVNPPPNADFSAPVTMKCQPDLTVNFQDISSGGAVAWQWNFGDGGTSTLQNPTHTYTSYGSFDVTLIATNSTGCKDTITKPGFIQVRRAQITIPQFPARGCIPYTVSPVPVINSVDAVTSYEWDFGDGGTSTLQNPTHTYPIQGDYTVRLIITTSGGCRDTLVFPGAVRVGSKPTVDFVATPIPVCGRQTVYFTSLASPADEWRWDFGDGGTSLLANPTYSYNDTGYFTVKLVATNFGCKDSLTKVNYTYVRPPIARFAMVADCNNRLRFTFTDQSVGPLTWDWNFGDGSPASNVQNPSHVFPALGTYQVRLIVTNNGCTDTLVQTVNAINENPDFTADRTVACRIADIAFTGTVNNPANITSYFWSFDGLNDTTRTSQPTVTNTYSNFGNYNVILVTTDINGCRDTILKPNYIRINGPAAGFQPQNAYGCSGLVTTFNDLSTTDGVNAIVNWQFNFGDGTVQGFTSMPAQHTYNAIDTFSVRLVVTDAAGCKDSTSLDNIIITTDPVPGFGVPTQSCPGDSIFFLNFSSPGNIVASYWEFGDGNSSTLTQPTHAYADTGYYTIGLWVTDNNGCTDSLIIPNYIHVSRPVSSFSVSDSVSSCLPFEVLFTNNSTFYNSSYWDFGPGEGSSTLTNPTHYFASPGSYPVKLVVTSPGGCMDSTIRNIFIYDTSGSRVDYLPIGGCSPLMVDLTSFTNGPVATYFWDFGDGYTVTTSSPNVSHIYTSFGNYLPKVIMEDPSGCLIPVAGLDTVFVIGAKAKFGLDRDVFCDFGTVNFTDSTTFNDPLLNYNWSFGDGGTSTDPNPAHYYSSPGLYTVQLIVNTQFGCHDTLTKPLLVRVVARPDIDIGGDTVVCVNSSISHLGVFLTPDTSVVTWEWQFPNGNQGAQQNPPRQYYIQPGTFTVTSMAMNSTGCRDTTIQNILVHTLPVSNIPPQITMTQGFPITIPGAYSSNTISWQWSPATGLSCTDCPSPVANPKSTTLYQVAFTDANGCTNSALVEIIVLCKDANLFLPNTFTPNGDGSNDVFYPRGRGLERVRMLRIFNRWGEVVFEKREFPVNNSLSGWDGTYKGQKPKADVYVYQVEVYCGNGEIIKLNGNIALVL